MKEGQGVRIKKKINTSATFVVIIVFILGGVFVGGFLVKTSFFEGGGQKEIGEVGKEIAFQKEAGKVTVEEADGLPKSFPGDFPIYPGAKIESSFTTKREETEALSVIWLTETPFEKVVEFYRTGFVAVGWEIDKTFESEESTTFSIVRDSQIGFVGIGVSDGSSAVISVTIGERFEEPSI